MQQVGPGDGFKLLSEVCEPDMRQSRMVVQGGSGWRSKTLSDLHGGISEIELGDYVPVDVRIQFDNARNLLLYSWFVFDRDS